MIPASINPTHLYPHTDATHCRLWFSPDAAEAAEANSLVVGYEPKHRQGNLSEAIADAMRALKIIPSGIR